MKNAKLLKNLILEIYKYISIVSEDDQFIHLNIEKENSKYERLSITENIEGKVGISGDKYTVRSVMDKIIQSGYFNQEDFFHELPSEGLLGGMVSVPFRFTKNIYEEKKNNNNTINS